MLPNFLLALTLALAIAPPPAAAQASAAPGAPAALNPTNSFLVRGAAVFDGQALRPATDVLVQAGRIAAVGPKLEAPAGTPVVEGRGRTLLPGLIDAHTHSWGEARREALRAGVTTELEMFGDTAALAAARAQRESLAPAAQADLWSAGTLATVPRGHGTQFGLRIPTLQRPEEAAAFVSARLAEGSDYLKIVVEDGSAFGQTTPSLRADTVAALVQAAHAAGKRAVAHVSTDDDAMLALRAGVDGLVHVFMNRPASAELLALARQRGVFVVATLSVAASVAGSDEGRSLSNDARLKPVLSAGQTASLRTPFPAGWQRASLLPGALENVRLLHGAGVPLLAGTDAGNPGTAHGASMHGELALLVRAGLSPAQALAAATAGPAQAFGLADRGRIVPGMRADLLLVEGDPLADIDATRAIVAVWKNGWAVDRTLRADETEAAAPTAPADPRIADFDGGSIAVRYGQNWMITSDAMAGGGSRATQAWQAGGADGTAGAPRGQGGVAAGLPYAWAGTMFMPGAKPFDAVDFSARKALVLKVRNTAGGAAVELGAMVFSGPATQRMPAVVRFSAGAAWAEVRIELSRFNGADFKQLRALAFTAGPQPGPFAFEIDDVRIE
jgi:imidazolonepropionase-like amidohydrolase